MDELGCEGETSEGGPSSLEDGVVDWSDVEPSEERIAIGESTQIALLVAGTQIKALLDKKHLDPKVWGTTLQRYIEKDGALDRRFQKVIINPPSVKESLKILFGLI